MSSQRHNEPRLIAGLKPRVMRIKQVAEYVGLAVSTIYQLQRQGRFPKPSACYPGMRVALYRVEDVEAWLDKQIGEDAAA